MTTEKKGFGFWKKSVAGEKNTFLSEMTASKRHYRSVAIERIWESSDSCSIALQIPKSRRFKPRLILTPTNSDKVARAYSFALLRVAGYKNRVTVKR
jgi:hypothetical protein